MERKITGVCFSPTGGTKRALEHICGLFGQAELLELGAGRQWECTMGRDELLVLALPVYAGQIPAVPGLLDGLSGNETPCIIVAAYGNRHYDNALAQIKKEVEARGFRCAAGAAVVTPHTFAPTLGAGRPDEADMEVLSGFARQVEEKLDRADWQPAQVPGDPNPPPKPAVPVEKDRDWDICLGCGVCAANCAKKAIEMKRRPIQVITPVNSTHRFVLQAIEKGTLQNLVFDNQAFANHRAMAAVFAAILELPPLKQALASKQFKSIYLDKLISSQLNKNKKKKN